MRNSRMYRRIALASALILLPGCFKLGRETQVLQQYVLGGARSAAPASADPAGGLTVGVRRLDLAPYLASPAIITRFGEHEIVVSEFHRWAEAPGESITRAVARYLADEPAIRAVDVAPWPARAAHDYLIQLHVARFEGAAPASASTGAAVLSASWEILQPQGNVLARGETKYSAAGWQVADYAGLVRLLDAGLSELARELNSCLQRVAALPATADSAAGAASNDVAAIDCARQS